MAEIEGKTTDVTNLETKTELTTVENKIPDVSKFATTNPGNKVPDISTLIKKVTMMQKLQKLKAKMYEILDLTQN